MTDTPGREPDGREPEPSSAARHAAAGRRSRRSSASRRRRRSARVELTPERAAQVVRQSSNARWVGFLAVVVVILFVVDLLVLRAGRAARADPARLEAEADAQQVTAVERGYNVYEANCARCHGEQGEGGDRPGPQPPGQAVRAPQRGLPAQRPDGRRPLRLRQPEVADAGLVGHRAIRRARSTTARSRSSSRSSARPNDADLHRPRRAPARPEDRPGHRRGRDLHGLARPELRAGARRDAVSRTAGRTSSPRRQRVAGPSGAPAPSASTDPSADGRRRSPPPSIAFDADRP